MYKKVEVELGGRSLTIETGKIAKQAGGAVVVTYGDSVVLVTATAASSSFEGATTCSISFLSSVILCSILFFQEFQLLLQEIQREFPETRLEYSS